jgi:hypothetical protein
VIVCFICVCVNSCISRSAIVCCMFVILLHVYDGAQSHVPHACSCTSVVFGMKCNLVNLFPLCAVATGMEYTGI